MEKFPKKIRKIKGKDLTSETHLRVIKFLNAAKRIEDFTREDGVKIKINKELAEKILEARSNVSPLGFRDISDVINETGIDPDILGDVIAGFDPSVYGEWNILYDTQLPNGIPVSVAHAALLRTGKVIFFQEGDVSDTIIWDPSDETNPQFTFPDNQPDDFLWCSGHSFLSDGTLLVCGGGGNNSANAINSVWKFNPVDGTNGTWTRTTRNMTQRRWYPTVVTLGDGRLVMIVGGSPATGSIEIYDAASERFTPITLGGDIRDFPQLYPGLHTLPGGQIFYSRTGWHGGADTVPTNAYFTFTSSTTGTWTEIPAVMEFPDRREGMSVLMLSSTDPSVRVMIIGGSGSIDKAEIIDLSTISPTWERSTTVPGGGRRHANAVLLPDSSVFVCGGTADVNAPCALYNPVDNLWSEMARLNYLKFYHSVALLLPSAKVVATGGALGEGEIRGSTAIEVFSPPYLFRGPRPVISSVQDAVRQGSVFDIDTPQAAEVQKVVLVRPMAVTHQTDTEQRVVQLNFSRSENTLKVNTPMGLQTNIAPKGYYLLFILNSSDVPSIGRFIFLS